MIVPAATAKLYRRPKPVAYFKPSRTIREVGRFLRLKLSRSPATKNIESFGESYSISDMMQAWSREEPLGFSSSSTWESVRNRFRWVAAYAVTGTSEGHYVHIDLVCETADETGMNLPDRKIRARRAVTVFTGKTFEGMDAAYTVARRVAALLDA